MSPLRLMSGCLAVVALSVIVESEARAGIGVPFPPNSTCPPAVTTSVDGSCCFDVIVHDFNNCPMSNSDVVIDFGTCVASFCPSQPPGITVIGNTVLAVTNPLGVAHFCICATFTPPCSARIYASGTFLCTVPMNFCGPTPNERKTWGTLKVHYR
jgi:hypothetical protein